MVSLIRPFPLLYLFNVGTQSDSNYQQVLAAEVPGDLQSIMLNPPSGGWPQGGGFRLNLVKDVNHLDTILAQSSEYDIGVSNTPSGSSLTRTATSPTTSAVRPTSESSAFISSAFTSSTVPVTATSSRSVAILPASSSAITTSASRAAAPSSSATSSTTALNAGSKTLAVHVGTIPFLVALNYLFM
ncbi:hypothetical protein C0992_004447 [Termitomyces sp. T32_za158]|nr:hypothetical protein C0992_004447 [Termitomyces sp. T32_za158]